MKRICFYLLFKAPTYLSLASVCLLLLCVSPSALLAIPPDEPLVSPYIGPQAPVGVWKPPIEPRVALRIAPQSDFNVCSCVSFARFKTGINVGPIGLAKHHPINSQIPHVGAILVMRGGPTGHLAAVTSVNEESIEVIEANNTRCQVTTRELRKDDARISGYYVN